MQGTQVEETAEAVSPFGASDDTGGRGMVLGLSGQFIVLTAQDYAANQHVDPFISPYLQELVRRLHQPKLREQLTSWPRMWDFLARRETLLVLAWVCFQF
ncbi:MAG: hypothetical protein HKL81_09285 [Acidimicrobiaceae bacterium]|nr:hypothetical protein [Acidimicrobiaceae bacterium]